MEDNQDRDINPRDNQHSQQGRFGSELDWDLEAEFNAASQTIEQSDSVVSVLPNPEWEADDDLALFRPPWSSQTVNAVDPVTYGTIDVASATSAYSGQSKVLDYGDVLDIKSDAAPDVSKGESSSSLTSLYQGPHANVRVDRVRRNLNEALERWWSYSQLPDLGVLRDGLLALEAGHDLDESQRSILMRSALHHRRGIHTALSHQTDPDRTAFLLQEALLDPDEPLPLDLLDELRLEDSQSEQWSQLLSQSLGEDLGEVVDDKYRRIRHILTRLEQPLEKRPPLEPKPQQVREEPIAEKSTLQPASPKLWALRPAHWSAPRLITALFILLLLMGVYLWQSQRATASKWAVIPEGTYTISDPSDNTQERIVTLDAFVIEQTEVTNWQYRRCYEAAVCTQPAYDQSATRPSYFMNRNFDSYPVVYVTWDEANTYCQWIDRHLPSAAEWEVAASIAPATQRRYLYPWGDRFQPELANTGANRIDDTQPVGLYHPAGDSSFGVWDMAGNVAEWTETAPAAQPDHALVKGGAYSDAADAVQTHAYQILPRTGSAPWLGFRCAKRLETVGK